jgi:F-type H+-transporting ATPase subunit delta
MKHSEGSLKKRYSQALFELCREAKDVQNLLTEMECFNEILDEEALEFFSSLAVDHNQKIEVIDYIGEKAQFSEHFLNFLKTLISYNRFSIVLEIFQEFSNKSNRILNILNVDVISSQPLVESETKELSDTLEDVLHKKIILNSSIDESLLAGYVLKFENKTIDASLKQRLEFLKQELMN